jgi:hypothetical protein
MSWINDRINYCKETSHTTIKALPKADCYSNETHHADLRDEKGALARLQAIECEKLIKELWLSACEESVCEENPTYCSRREQGDKFLQATKVKPLRRNWHIEAA